jgi:hypothetical protein
MLTARCDDLLVGGGQAENPGGGVVGVGLGGQESDWKLGEGLRLAWFGLYKLNPGLRGGGGVWVLIWWSVGG